jgi:cell division protease FtsH
MVLMLWSVVDQPQQKTQKIKYSEFREALDKGRIEQVVIKDREITGKYKDGYGDGESAKFTTFPPPEDPQLIEDLIKAGADFDGSPQEEESWYLLLLANWFPMLLLIGVWIFFMRQIQVGGGKALSFGKSRARLLEENTNKVTFDDVAGIEESKEELSAIVQFLKDPKKFTRLGGRIPKGVLLVGSPGTGKTLLARAIAGEAGVPFFSISGSDFVEMFVGVGASRVRDLFMKGKKNAPCIIFIDEIDAVGRHRGAGLGGGHDEREQTLNQMLVEMDGFEPNEGVILVAATNRPDVLDPALLRPGRFDRTVVVPLPDLRGREAILKVHTKKVPLEEDIDLASIARGTPGFSGADLANLVNESALYAALQDVEHVSTKHFEYAKDKIIMGVERRSLLLTEREREITAYHEAGHALTARLIPGSDPVHKVTIVPRGVALGLMQQLPEEEKHNFSRSYWLDRICIAFGGRTAEEIIFNEITTGAGGDISQATSIAKKMVCEWGMSEKLGALAYGKDDSAVFLGKELGHQKDYSEETASQIDTEVREIVESQHVRCRDLLSGNQETLRRLAAVLLKKETLDADEVDAIISGDWEPPEGNEPPNSSNNGNADSNGDIGAEIEVA